MFPTVKIVGSYISMLLGVLFLLNYQRLSPMSLLVVISCAIELFRIISHVIVSSYLFLLLNYSELSPMSLLVVISFCY